LKERPNTQATEQHIDNDLIVSSKRLSYFILFETWLCFSNCLSNSAFTYIPLCYIYIVFILNFVVFHCKVTHKKVNIRTWSLLCTFICAHRLINCCEYSSIKLLVTYTTSFLERPYCVILRNGQLKYITVLTSRMRCISYACSIDNDVSCLCANIHKQQFSALSSSLFLIYLTILGKTCMYRIFVYSSGQFKFLIINICVTYVKRISKLSLHKECSSENR